MFDSPGALFDVGRPATGGESAGGTIKSFATPGEHPKAAAFRNQFAGWMNNTLRAVGGGLSQMEATAPSGPISVGSGSGLDSIAITIPTEILPYLPSYFNLDSFALAGATQFYTDHTRPLTKPIMSAGAPDSVIAENAASTTSQPFGLSGFTFGGVKYERLVLASYEALMNSELPLQGAILDELMATLATTLTAATTTSFVAALTGASSTLATGVGGSGGSIYTSMIDLRHAVPPRFDLPTNKWMLSRATLAQIRNTRATTSGVPMFSPDGTMLFDRPYVINDNLDTASGGGVGFVAFGSFADGVWLRRTPVMTRVFLELFANSGQLGFRTTQWADAHYLAELAGAAQPPTNQPIYYSNVVSES
jgi:HK97 family phage major capsid protein